MALHSCEVVDEVQSLSGSTQIASSGESESFEASPGDAKVVSAIDSSSLTEIEKATKIFRTEYSSQLDVEDRLKFLTHLAENPNFCVMFNLMEPDERDLYVRIFVAEKRGRTGK